MLKEINDDDKDLKRNPSFNQNLTRFFPVSVTILVLYFHFQCLLWAAADLWFYSQFLLMPLMLLGVVGVEKIRLEAVNWVCQHSPAPLRANNTILHR